MTNRRAQKPIASPPLLGANVVVTRPTAAAGPFKRRVGALGGNTLVLPGIAIRRVAEADAARAALRDARTTDIAIFVSPNAVRHAFDLLPRLRFSRTTRVCAVGRATALALARHGVRDVVWPIERQDSEGLLALSALQDVSRRRAVSIGAAGGRDLIATTLRARGATLQSIHVYRRAAPRWSRRHFDALDRAASPILTLLSSAQALACLAADLPAALFAKLAAGDGIVSSLRLAEAARAAGFVRTHVAASPNADAMLATAVTALAQHRL